MERGRIIHVIGATLPLTAAAYRCSSPLPFTAAVHRCRSPLPFTASAARSCPLAQASTVAAQASTVTA
ncbi:hypothetical protein SAMN05216551_101613 [Chitinasiproducens palmae]|uniref:Uncharacterized protein n=1 Tax=Chitinasiproducens palmae TaxID=1770053 RepID=A0A1H2PKD2_9BURK|nr:hypothetical protein SAMN05216551_101613 [Chitinasiproducens palmae]